MIGFAALCFTNCAFLKDLVKTPENQAAISVATKMDAFALASKFLDSSQVGLEVFDFAQGNIKTNYIEFRHGLVHAKTKLVFVFDAEKKDLQVIGAEVLEEKMESNGYSHFDRDPILKDYNGPVYANLVNNQLKNCAVDSACMSKARESFRSNFTYNYLILKTLTEVGRDKFTKENFLGKNYSWDLPLDNLVFNKDNTRPFKYIALFSVAVKESSIWGNLLGSSVFIRYYTNSNALVDMVKKQSVAASGLLKSIDAVYTNDSFNFDFEEEAQKIK